MSKEDGDALRAKWLEDAKKRGDLGITIENQDVLLEAKQFSTGSVGYGFSGKIKINGERVQGSINLVVVGSKEWGKEAE